MDGKVIINGKEVDTLDNKSMLEIGGDYYQMTDKSLTDNFLSLSKSTPFTPKASIKLLGIVTGKQIGRAHV